MGLGMDFGQVMIGGVLLIPLVMGWMEVAKRHFGLSGRALVATAIVALLLFGGIAGAIEEELIPALAMVWIRVVVYALAFALVGLAGMGLYDLAWKFRTAGWSDNSDCTTQSSDNAAWTRVIQQK